MEKIELTEEQHLRFVEFLKWDDLDFYEHILMDDSMEDKKSFFEEFPDFLEDYPLNPLKSGRIELLDDRSYRGIMRKVKERSKDRDI